MSTYNSIMIRGAIGFINLWKQYEIFSNFGFPEFLKPGLRYNRNFGWKIVFGNNDDNLYYPSTINEFVQIAKVCRRIENPCVDLNEHETIDFKVLELYSPKSHIN